MSVEREACRVDFLFRQLRSTFVIQAPINLAIFRVCVCVREREREGEREMKIWLVLPITARSILYVCLQIVFWMCLRVIKFKAGDDILVGGTVYTHM